MGPLFCKLQIEEVEEKHTPLAKINPSLRLCFEPFPRHARLRKNNVCTPLLVNISVYSGHEAQGFRKRTPLVSTLVERWYMAPGVKRVIVSEKGVQATLFIPPGEFVFSKSLLGFYFC